jgi:hypothetical protein
MALTWNIEKCENYQELEQSPAWGITDTLIWLTIAVGMNEITKDNWREFYARLHLLETLYGAYAHTPNGPYYITREQVKRRIGLRTNASKLTQLQFVKLKVNRFLNDAIRGDN